MAVPTYTTDLSTFELCEGTTGCDEFVNMEDGGTESYQDTDDIIQGSYHISAQCSLKVGELQSLGMDAGSGVTIPTDGAILMWFKFDAGGILDTYTNGGVRAVIGQSYTNWDAWKAGGSDNTPNPYGGWYNYAINPTARTYDYRNGTGTGTTYQYAGMAIDVTSAGPTKGQPFKIDGFRYGRGSIILEYGSLADGYATFANAAAKNDANDATDGYNRWGLLSASSGGYLWKGRMQLGTATNALEMTDSNVFILVEDVVNCTSSFNTIEVNHASTIVDWTNVIFKSLGTTSPGRLVMNANANLDLDGCQFFDMGAFTFGGTNSEFLNCTWNGCGLVTVDGGKLNGSKVLNSTVAADAAAIDWDVNTDPDGYLDNLEVSEGTNSHHAIEFGSTCPSSLTIRGLDVGADFASTDAQTNSTFYVSDTNTGNSYTINCVGCSGNMTYKSAGAGVTIVNDPVTVKATCVKTDGSVLQNVRVFAGASAKSSGTATTDTADKLVDTGATFSTDGVVAGDIAFNQTDGTSATVSAVDSETSLSLSSDAFPDGNEDYRVGGTFPVEDTVTISNSGTTATVTHTGHGMATNDYIFINGGTVAANQGVFQITYISANSYSYTMASTPGSSPTGTINATFVALFGLSNASGVVSTTRVYTVDQPFDGWARNTVGGTPYLKEGILTGTIDGSDGVTATAVLVSDE